MAALEFRFLGDFEVRRDGEPLALPPSKKTRALLAYLSLHDRSFRRENLCELLWEIPDDPRGSLRWSLSKLRRLIDDGDRARIVADRASVAVDTGDVAIDVADLRALANDSIAERSVEELQEAVVRFRGNFLEGLEFSNFHDFHAWCVALREQSIRDQVVVLGELVRRLETEPEAALPHARARVGLVPYDEPARIELIKLLHAAKHPVEAEQQYQLGVRMLKEAGVDPSPALRASRKAARIDAPRVAAATAAPPGPVEVSIPDSAGAMLLGRDTEATLLEDTCATAVREGRTRMLLVRGAPGIGKSCVLEAATDIARRHEALVIHAAAFESDGVRPFGMWIDALRVLGDEAERVFADSDDANRGRLFAGLSELVAHHATNRPVALIFDDFHWCDESGAAALHYVARMNRDRPIFGVLAARAGELRDNAPAQQALRGLRRDGLLQEIGLGELAEDALAELIEARAPGADGERLCRECGGNPLLAIELARAEIEGGSGDSLEDLVRERLLRFDVVGAEVIRWAAVLNPRIDVATLVEVAGVDADQVGAVLEIAERHAMLISNGAELRFSHDLIAKAVYTDISPIRRQVMHRRVAEWLEKSTALDLSRASNLAHHAGQSRDPGLAARSMVSAGRLCLRFFANDDARSLARGGLQYAEQLADAERICVVIELHDILLSAAPLEDWEAAADMYTAMAETALDHGELSHARLGYHMASYVRWEHGQWAGAREQTLQAERAIRGGSDEAHVVGMAETAKCLLLLERDLAQADAMLMEAGSIAERGKIVHHAVPAGNGMLRLHQNRLEEAEELFQESRTLCKSAGDRWNEYLADEHLVMIDVQRGRYEDARSRCAELLELGDKLREGSEAPFARALDALCAYALSDDAAAIDAPLEELRVVDAKHRMAYILTRAALLDLERERVEPAMERAEEALGHAGALDRATELLLARAILEYGFRQQGDAERAAESAAEIERLSAVGAAAWAVGVAIELAGRN